jgi:signal transduction histidine kinase
MGGIINKIPLDKKRSLIYSHCFMLDSLGFCWISTNRGLLKARMDDLIGSYQVPSKEIYYHYYGIQDGMATSEMNGGCYPCAIQLKSGTLSFPTMDGLAWVSPKAEEKIVEKGGLYVDEIIINKKTKLSLDSFPPTLPAFTKQISISLAYAAWSNLENIYIYYRLNNKDQWQELPFNSPSLLEINNLEPGSYQLQIRKLNGFGNDNFTLLSIPFVIDKPWYNKWWFYLIAITSGFGLIGLFLKIQTYRLQKSEKKLRRLVDENTAALKQQYEKLEKNNRIMSRLISIINHDIITPLKFIHVAGKNLLNRKTKVSEEINQETIVEITNTALELQDLSTNILNWIRYQQKNKLLKKAAFKPIELAEQVTRVLGSSAKIKYLELKINIEPDLTILQYAEPFRILIHNLVSNSIHFTEQGVIEIGLEKKNGNWLLWVKDNGVGMNQRQVENILIGETIISSATVDKRKGHGLGYQIIKDLLELMEARIEIQSTKGIGTTVIVYFD